MLDPIDSAPFEPNDFGLTRSYPDTPVGTMRRQLDIMQQQVDADRAMAAICTARAEASTVIVAQLQAAIDAMPPDPS